MYKLLKKSGDTANFSAILPGSCNAKCSFCFWRRSYSESPLYTQQLSWYLDALGDKITQISITGGEPTLSPFFDDVMAALKGRSIKVVLTSNGSNVEEKLPSMAGIVRHINISRHAIQDAENRAVFNTDSVPDKAKLAAICDMANNMNIDITLNKVVPQDYNNTKELLEYISFIKSIGASSLAIRKDYSCNTLELLPLETSLGQKGTNRSCPVCTTNSYLVKGIPVHFKYSLEEPSKTLSYIYEFIYHPDGILTEDWAANKRVQFEKQEEQTVFSPTRKWRSYSHTSCGQTSSRSDY